MDISIYPQHTHERITHASCVRARLDTTRIDKMNDAPPHFANPPDFIAYVIFGYSPRRFFEEWNSTQILRYGKASRGTSNGFQKDLDAYRKWDERWDRFHPTWVTLFWEGIMLISFLIKIWFLRILVLFFFEHPLYIIHVINVLESKLFVYDLRSYYKLL